MGIRATLSRLFERPEPREREEHGQRHGCCGGRGHGNDKGGDASGEQGQRDDSKEPKDRGHACH